MHVQRVACSAHTTNKEQAGGAHTERGGVWSSHLERESSGLVEESAQGSELE